LDGNIPSMKEKIEDLSFAKKKFGLEADAEKISVYGHVS
jgi:hypothetical protein